MRELEECRIVCGTGLRGTEMSLTPAYDEKEARKRKEEIELCGKNRGPHDYFPIEYSETGNSQPAPFNIVHKRVTRLLCRVCFRNVAIKELLETYPEIKG